MSGVLRRWVHRSKESAAPGQAQCRPGRQDQDRIAERFIDLPREQKKPPVSLTSGENGPYSPDWTRSHYCRACDGHVLAIVRST
jgi:hypothetical protein